jgi:hypothetical protein
MVALARMRVVVAVMFDSRDGVGAPPAVMVMLSLLRKPKAGAGFKKLKTNIDGAAAGDACEA